MMCVYQMNDDTLDGNGRSKPSNNLYYVLAGNELLSYFFIHQVPAMREETVCVCVGVCWSERMSECVDC